MNEYIEKAELIKKLCFETAEWCYSPTIKTIKDFPAADVQPINRWISCKDKMPEDRTLVLFCYVNEKGLKSVHYGYHFNINGITAWAKPSGGLNYCDEEITHWQPLPEPPKDGEHND